VGIKKKGDISSVHLSREELLTISSNDLESRISTLSSERKLSPLELKEVKRQRRLVKNREYAQQSRVKKKQFVQELEVQVNHLTDENRKLKYDNSSLLSRISALEQENNYLRQYSQVQSSNTVPNNDIETSQDLNLINSGNQDIQSVNPSSNWNQSFPYPSMPMAFYFIILFSFGFLFNFGIFDSRMENKFAAPVIKEDYLLRLPFKPRDLLQVTTSSVSLVDNNPYLPNITKFMPTMDDVEKDPIIFEGQCFNYYFNRTRYIKLNVM